MRITESGHGRTGRRVAIASAIGLVTGAASGFALGLPFAVPIAWIVAAALYLLWTWLAIGRMDSATTRARARTEDPSVRVAHLVLVIASLASLGGVALLLLATGKDLDVIAGLLGVLSVTASWFTVHTVYTLGYAASYYGGEDGGIDFNQKQPPAYLDFAYVGFTLGMTYQVSDTTITDPSIRRLVLQHTLLSYLLGAVVLAIAINLVAGIAG